MTTYSLLSDDEKNQIKVSAIRDLEYQMYTLEIQIMLENAKSEPDQNRIQSMTSEIETKQSQIAAVQ